MLLNFKKNKFKTFILLKYDKNFVIVIKIAADQK